MINVKKTEKEIKMLMMKKAVKMTAEKMKKKKKIKKKMKKYMHADSACRMMMMTMTACNDTETFVSMTTS